MWPRSLIQINMFPVDFFLREYASNIFKQHLDEKVSSSDNNSEEEEEEEFHHSSKKDSLILCLVLPTLKISISSKKSPTSSQPTGA